MNAPATIQVTTARRQAAAWSFFTGLAGAIMAASAVYLVAPLGGALVAGAASLAGRPGPAPAAARIIEIAVPIPSVAGPVAEPAHLPLPLPDLDLAFPDATPDVSDDEPRAKATSAERAGRRGHGRHAGGHAARLTAPVASTAGEIATYTKLFSPSAETALVLAPIHPKLPRRISDADVGEVVSSNRPAIKRCHDRALKRKEMEEGGRVELAVTLKPSGKVERVDVGAPHAHDFIGGCLRDEIARWDFPKFAGPSATYRSTIILVSSTD